MEKKKFKINLQLVIEAIDIDEAFAVLTSKETVEYLSKALSASKDKIVSVYEEQEENETIIIN